MIKPIHNENDYQMALNRVGLLWGSQQDTAEGDELDVLLVLIEAYENQHYLMPPSDPLNTTIVLKPKSRDKSTLKKNHLKAGTLTK